MHGTCLLSPEIKSVWGLQMSLPKAVLLDIEGTTTPIDFVYRKLFPYARDHLNEFLEKHISDMEVSECLKEIAGNIFSDTGKNDLKRQRIDPGSHEIKEYILSLIEKDSKITPFKKLEAMIWQEGYNSGELRGEVYPDVPPALKRWHESGIVVSIYSSGNIKAQQAIFSTTTYGDLTRYIFSYFDTTTGPKTSPESYDKISGLIGVDPSRIVFISDNPNELIAAQEAEFLTYLSVRSDSANKEYVNKFRSINTFSELSF